MIVLSFPNRASCIIPYVMVIDLIGPDILLYNSIISISRVRFFFRLLRLLSSIQIELKHAHSTGIK